MSPNSTVSDVFETLLPHLAERVRVIHQAPINMSAEFVLYWMHHAVRDHDNPALDTALSVAQQCSMPVLIYQGLGGRHRYNSDRHHTFIMEGAREVQQRLRDRSITHLFHLGRRPNRLSPLRELIRRAALVITEDFPAPPFPQWTQSLAAQTSAAVWAVDCACIIPMQSIKKPFARAYAFRNHTQKEYQRRLSQVWEDVSVQSRRFEGECGFEAIDLTNADIAHLCAQCEIDHTVPPVEHTQGGSSSGYARWENFKRHGLKSYARLRNDATVIFPRGVSRLSAYLHHGHVSPFRIAQEAANDGSSGAVKYLDELLIWRELAHNFCFYQAQPESIDVLPQWARETLKKHQEDIRRTVYSWEQLLRGKTGDALWDAAQKSLLVHGELHNNVRMTWGKAILTWARDPQEALNRMIDLNHRLALDGNDPNSYGGLLWCLGLFDRPFKPEQPIIGALRPRPTQQHARRIDMQRYTDKIDGPASGNKLKIAVVGAGISGLFAARTVHDQGHDVHVFEANDHAGGRTTSIKLPLYEFDTGAQYFTVRDDRLARYVRSWQVNGIVEPWKGRVMVARKGQIAAEKQITERWVGVPAMDSIADHLAQDLVINFNVRIVSTRKKGHHWHLIADDQTSHGPFDVIMISAPPPEAQCLVKSSVRLHRHVSAVKMQPCQALMMAFDKPLDVPFDAAFIHGSPVRWAARNCSKPRRRAAECWVLHAGARWSSTHAGDDNEQIIEMLLDAFFEDIGHKRIDPVYLSTRYWESAAAANPLNVGCLWDAHLKIGICGDWCRMSRLEGAALSGMAMAGRVLSAKAN